MNRIGYNCLLGYTGEKLRISRISADLILRRGLGKINLKKMNTRLPCIVRWVDVNMDI
jgi:hypothetical protein